MVQNELAALTMVEMKKRDMKVITIIILDIVVLMFECEMSALQWDVLKIGMKLSSKKKSFLT